MEGIVWEYSSLTFVLAQSTNSVRSAGNDKAATTFFVGLPITIFSWARFLNDVEYGFSAHVRQDFLGIMQNKNGMPDSPDSFSLPPDPAPRTRPF